MSITTKDVVHVAKLARLALSDEDSELYTRQLQRILGHVEKLSELDTSSIEPMTHAVHVRSHIREDKSRASLDRADALGNAPESTGGCFKVPKIIE